ncbi:MAG: cytidylate kinase-like family protein [Myxococcota bacterium]|nr:cytidylate kinase-like family protein [Myxococcota bacterium]
MPTNIGSLLDHQARRWQLSQPRPAEVPRPCIALSRLPWSLGATLGRAVAEQLDYGFFDKEILDLIASEKGVTRRLVEGVDENVVTGIEKLVTDAFHLRLFTESEYLRHLVRVVTSLGARGAAVLVGRGAPHILSARRALRVLVVAGPEKRAANLAEAEGLSLEDARKQLAQMDAKRADFSKRQFGVRQDDPCLYDLVVNTETLGLEAAGDLIVQALRHRFPDAVPAGASAGS